LEKNGTIFTNATYSWANQVAWISALSVDFGGTTFDGWRLPAMVNGHLNGQLEYND
jgi:hypothetical protein